MDNISHTLVGALVGAYMARTRRSVDSALDERTRHKLFVPMLAVGSNLPDIDLVYTSIYSGKLDYLLHHRGHTHTILGALILGALLWLAAEWFLKRKHIQPTSSDRKWVIAIALFGPLLHVFMDATNSYGVHPFWPFDNAWYYLDTIFIVEPLLWACAAPLMFIAHTKFARAVIALVLAVGVGLAYFTGLVPVVLCAVLVAVIALLAWAGRALEPRVSLFLGIAVWLTTTLVFSMANREVSRLVRSVTAEQTPAAALLDHVLTPMPVNPFCWEVMLVQTQGDRYALRRAMVSTHPGFIPARECPMRSTEITAPLVEIKQASSDGLEWAGEALMSLDDLSKLTASRCEARALMQFARAPWWMEGPTSWIMGDLRYDREPTLGFAEIELSGPQTCPRHGAPWTPPRQDLLDRTRDNTPSG